MEAVSLAEKRQAKPLMIAGFALAAFVVGVMSAVLCVRYSLWDVTVISPLEKDLPALEEYIPPRSEPNEMYGTTTLGKSPNSKVSESSVEPTVFSYVRRTVTHQVQAEQVGGGDDYVIKPVTLIGRGIVRTDEDPNIQKLFPERVRDANSRGKGMFNFFYEMTEMDKEYFAEILNGSFVARERFPKDLESRPGDQEQWRLHRMKYADAVLAQIPGARIYIQLEDEYEGYRDAVNHLDVSIWQSLVGTEVEVPHYVWPECIGMMAVMPGGEMIDLSPTCPG